jgi:mannosylglycerate hydrolase
MSRAATVAEVHLVSHTHWDREWYLTREQFRLRLVDLIDRVLEMLRAGPSFAFFHLDGQTIVLEDYLEIRPERDPDLRKLIGEGRLLVGPWYVMPDEFLVSGESLVRNLALGHRTARSFGGSMPVGYLPDLFGHVGQMPQILRQFGLDNAVLWRGFGGRDAEYWWEAPDGSRVLMLHLPQEGYCNATRVALVPARMVQRAEAAIGHELARSRVGVALLMNGVDHVEPQDTVPELIRQLKARGHEASHSTLPAYVERVRSAVASNRGAALEVIRGELREGEDYAPLLPGVLSARVYLKQANARVQRELERWAEPLSAFAWVGGSPYPQAPLRYAWKTLLQNHPHDSICGCSIDAVHEENMTRFARAGQVAEDLSGRAAEALGRAVAPPPDGCVRTVLLHTSGTPFSGVAEATLDLPYESAEPGRHVDEEALEAPVRFWPATARPIEARGPDGAPRTFQILSETDTVAFVTSRFETPWALRVKRLHLAVEALGIPGCGYSTIDWRIGEAASAQEASPASPRANTGLLDLSVKDDGTVDVTHLPAGLVYRGCGGILDEGDVGDEYTYSPPANDRQVTDEDVASVRIARVHAGPLRTAYRIDRVLRVPARTDTDRASRSQTPADLEVSTVVTLDRGAEFVTWDVAVVNTARDHRLRLLFPSAGQPVVTAVADSAFGTVERPARRDEAAVAPRVERRVSYAPMQSFVHVGDDDGGLAVVTDGLMEYEVLQEPSGPGLAVTLLRSVGALSRDDLVMRPHGHAGPGLDTPGAQCLGPHRFRLAMAPGIGRADVGALYQTAARVLTPPRAWTPAACSGSGPAEAHVIEVNGPVVLSACKRADDGESLVVRYFNPAPRAAAVRLALATPVAGAFLLDLLEARVETLDVVDGQVHREVRGHGMETIELVVLRRSAAGGTAVT